MPVSQPLMTGAAGPKPRGERSAAHSVVGVDGLTPAERRVALLVLHGQRNPQIAQGLIVTIKTVETHLAGLSEARHQRASTAARHLRVLKIAS
jgi:DNA-binding CsgD family transcriptional regulator